MRFSFHIFRLRELSIRRQDQPQPTARAHLSASRSPWLQLKLHAPFGRQPIAIELDHEPSWVDYNGNFALRNPRIGVKEQ